MTAHVLVILSTWSPRGLDGDGSCIWLALPFLDITSVIYSCVFFLIYCFLTFFGNRRYCESSQNAANRELPVALCLACSAINAAHGRQQNLTSNIGSPHVNICSPVFDVEGRHTAYSGMETDISERCAASGFGVWGGGILWKDRSSHPECRWPTTRLDGVSREDHNTCHCSLSTIFNTF